MNEIIKQETWEYGKYSEDEIRAMSAFTIFQPYLTTFFKEYSGTPYGCHFDVLAVNHTGGTEVVELKFRDKSVTKQKDCFIEPEKWISLMKDWREKNLAPLYINFIGGTDEIYMWFLPSLQGWTIKFHTNVKVETDNGNYQIVDRLGLAWDTAYHYVWNKETQSYIQTKPSRVNNNIIEKARQYEV